MDPPAPPSVDTPPDLALSISTTTQAVVDAVQAHDGGLAAILAATQAEDVAMQAAAAARQHTADVQAMQASSSAVVVERAQAAMQALQALIDAHSGGGGQ